MLYWLVYRPRAAPLESAQNKATVKKVKISSCHLLGKRPVGRPVDALETADPASYHPAIDREPDGMAEWKRQKSTAQPWATWLKLWFSSADRIIRLRLLSRRLRRVVLTKTSRKLARCFLD